MKEKIPLIAGGLLGLVFVVFGANFFLKFIPVPQPPEGSAMASFMGAMYTTGMLAFVKVLEIAGGVLVAIPKTRNFGLLILTPIIVVILAVHVFIMGGAGLFDPPVVLITALSAYLLWADRAQFAGLANQGGLS
ncbi:MAG: hypothetical protein AAF492_21785 [Verrucomicrobiota bacterium]